MSDLSAAPVTTYAAIIEALQTADTALSIGKVKAAVATSIRGVDGRVSIETTDYFNHSFAPDLVLKWPHLPASPERFVFLRFNSEVAWIEDELKHLSHRSPVIYGLSPTSVNLPGVSFDADKPATANQQVAAELQSAAVESDTLVTDPAGIDRLGAEPTAGLGGLVGRAVLRAGRGLIDVGGAETVTHTITSGFNAARATDTVGTAAAIVEADTSLAKGEASRLVSLLRAVWEGSGGDAEAFPQGKAPGGDPGNDGLAFLVQGDEIADDDFWRSLGANLSLKRLGNLGISGTWPNLQRLIGVNLDRLWARACRVRAEQPTLDSEEGPSYQWRLDSSLVALTGGGFAAYLGSIVDDLAQVKADKKVGVSVSKLQTRAAGVTVDNLEVSNGERVVTYSSEDQTDVAKDGSLASVLNALGTPTVRRAGVHVSGRRLELDFTTGTISARTSGKPPLRDILGTGLPLMWDLSESDRTKFDALLSAPDTEPPSLFSELNEDDDSDAEAEDEDNALEDEEAEMPARGGVSTTDEP